MVILGWAFAGLFWAIAAFSALGTLVSIVNTISGYVQYQSFWDFNVQVPALTFWIWSLFISLMFAAFTTMIVETYRKVNYMHKVMVRNILSSQIKRLEQEERMLGRGDKTNPSEKQDKPSYHRFQRPPLD